MFAENQKVRIHGTNNPIWDGRSGFIKETNEDFSIVRVIDFKTPNGDKEVDQDFDNSYIVPEEEYVEEGYETSVKEGSFEDLANAIECNGPSFRGDAYPTFKKDKINEEKFADGMRMKSFDAYSTKDNKGIWLDWTTQEDFKDDDYEGFKAEVVRCINELAKELNITKPFYLELTVTCRSGQEFGYNKEYIPFNGFDEDLTPTHIKLLNDVKSKIDADPNLEVSHFEPNSRTYDNQPMGKIELEYDKGEIYTYDDGVIEDSEGGVFNSVDEFTSKSYLFRVEESTDNTIANEDLEDDDLPDEEESTPNTLEEFEKRIVGKKVTFKGFSYRDFYGNWIEDEDGNEVPEDEDEREEYKSFVEHTNEECTITGCAISDGFDPDESDEENFSWLYWDAEFEDGFQLEAAQGDCFDLKD